MACEYCKGITPLSWTLSVSGFEDTNCTYTDLNGNYILNEITDTCIFSNDDNVSLSILDGNWQLTISNANGIATYVATAPGCSDCPPCTVPDNIPDQLILHTDSTYAGGGTSPDCPNIVGDVILTKIPHATCTYTSLPDAGVPPPFHYVWYLIYEPSFTTGFEWHLYLATTDPHIYGYDQIYSSPDTCEFPKTFTRIFDGSGICPGSMTSWCAQCNNLNFPDVMTIETIENSTCNCCLPLQMELDDFVPTEGCATPVAPLTLTVYPSCYTPPCEHCINETPDSWTFEATGFNNWIVPGPVECEGTNCNGIYTLTSEEGFFQPCTWNGFNEDDTAGANLYFESGFWELLILATNNEVLYRFEGDWDCCQPLTVSFYSWNTIGGGPCIGTSPNIYPETITLYPDCYTPSCWCACCPECNNPTPPASCGCWDCPAGIPLQWTLTVSGVSDNPDCPAEAGEPCPCDCEDLNGDFTVTLMNACVDGICLWYSDNIPFSCQIGELFTADYFFFEIIANAYLDTDTWTINLWVHFSAETIGLNPFVFKDWALQHGFIDCDGINSLFIGESGITPAPCLFVDDIFMTPLGDTLYGGSGICSDCCNGALPLTLCFEVISSTGGCTLTPGSQTTLVWTRDDTTHDSGWYGQIDEQDIWFSCVGVGGGTNCDGLPIYDCNIFATFILSVGGSGDSIALDPDNCDCLPLGLTFTVDNCEIRITDTCASMAYQLVKNTETGQIYARLNKEYMKEHAIRIQIAKFNKTKLKSKAKNVAKKQLRPTNRPKKPCNCKGTKKLT